jgi:peptide-methionine (S)-S-oxide reductase
MANNLETVVFGGGCFWCTEAVFKSLKGVVSVESGYAGGTMKDPGYMEVSQGNTGHAEVVKIVFDSNILKFKDLLEIFWNVHNPTSLNRQGNDVGTQYRSIILYTTQKQKKEAEESKEELEKSKQYESPIVTEILPLDKFYEAEEYHKDYYQNHKDEPYCELVINPKLSKLRQKFSKFIAG